MKIFMKICLTSILAITLSPFTVYALAETGVSDTEIVLGTTTNISGPNPARAVGVQEGAEVYFDKINKAGGVHGRKIRFVKLDDKFDPKMAAENAEKLVKNEKIFAFFQPYGATPTKAVRGIAERLDIPLLFPFAQANDLSVPVSKNIFNIRARSFNESASMVQFIIEKGFKNVVIAHQADSAGTDQKAGVQKALAEKNLKLKDAVAVKVGEKDLDPVVDALIKSQPDVVLLSVQGVTSIEILNRMVEKGAKPAFLGFSNIVTDDIATQIKDKSVNVYLWQSAPLLTDTKYPVVHDYLNDSKSAGTKPSTTGIEGYVDAKVLVAALEKAGKNLTRDSLRTTLESFKDFDVGGYKISFSPQNHQGLTELFIFKVSHGKLVLEKQ